MGGMSNKVFLASLKIIPIEIVFAIILEIFISGLISEKIAFSIINPREEKPYIITTVIICSTIVLMCPMMSFVAAMLFNGITVVLIATGCKL